MFEARNFAHFSVSTDVQQYCLPHLNYATTLPCENNKIDNFKHFAETIQQYHAQVRHELQKFSE